MNIDLSKPIECFDSSAVIVGSVFQYGNRLYGWLSFNSGTPFASVWSLSGESHIMRIYDIRNAPEVVVDYCNDYRDGPGRWHKTLEACNQSGNERRIAIKKRTRRLDAQGNLIGLPTYEAIAP